MGNETGCTCLGDPRDSNQEFTIGTGVYKFKKIVCNKKIIDIL